VANTAEILAQFSCQTGTNWTPLLYSVLPHPGSLDYKLIKESLPGVVIDHCRIRHGKEVAPSSYIFRSQDSGSRTIVNFNDLDDISLDDFQLLFKKVGWQAKWWHFEVHQHSRLAPTLSLE
jgi:ketohexokinase